MAQSVYIFKLQKSPAKAGKGLWHIELIHHECSSGHVINNTFLSYGENEC